MKSLFLAVALAAGAGFSCDGDPFARTQIVLSKAEPGGVVYEQATLVDADLVSACALPNSLDGYDRYQDTGAVWNGAFAARTITLTYCRARVVVDGTTVDVGPSDGMDIAELEAELGVSLVYDSPGDPPPSADPAAEAVVDVVVTNDPQRNPGLLPLPGYCFVIDEAVRRDAVAEDPPGCAP